MTDTATATLPEGAIDLAGITSSAEWAAADRGARKEILSRAIERSRQAPAKPAEPAKAAARGAAAELFDSEALERAKATLPVRAAPQAATPAPAAQPVEDATAAAAEVTVV